MEINVNFFHKSWKKLSHKGGYLRIKRCVCIFAWQHRTDSDLSDSIKVWRKEGMKKTVLIIDHDPVTVLQLTELLKRDSRITLIHSCNNGIDGLEQIRFRKPDLVLMESFLPGIDGLELIQRVRQDPLITYQPVYIMISAVTVPALINQALTEGVLYYIMKPYDEKMLMKKLSRAISGKKDGDSRMTYPSSMISETISLEAQTGKMLREVGVPPHLKGYTYLVDAIMMSYEHDPGHECSITKLIYPSVARMNQTTPSRVERAMRHAIEVAWEKGHAERMYELVARNRYSLEHGQKAGSRGKPTNSEFMACSVSKLRELTGTE